MDFKQTNQQVVVQFNRSIYLSNEANRWKFLENIEPNEASVGFLIMSPIPVLIMSVLYVLFTCILGPAIMRHREPFHLKTTIRIYNLFMVLAAAYLYRGLHEAVGTFGSLFDCEKTFTFEDGSASKVYQLGNFILCVRVCEYLDTIFFTLRKKQNQVTFLHVFHHVFVPLYAYWVIRTAPVRFNTYILYINSFVHVFMYFYYLLATFQPSRDGKQSFNFLQTIIVKLLKFKKYMTQLQIMQFVTLALYAIWSSIQPNRCNISGVYITSNLMLAFGFLGLFVHFYLSVYKIKQAQVADTNVKPKLQKQH